jgi:hypothetical protein
MSEVLGTHGAGENWHGGSHPRSMVAGCQVGEGQHVGVILRVLLTSSDDGQWRWQWLQHGEVEPSSKMRHGVRWGKYLHFIHGSERIRMARGEDCSGAVNTMPVLGFDIWW